MRIKFYRYWKILSFLEFFLEVDSFYKCSYLHSFEDGVFEIQWGPLYLSANRVASGRDGKLSCITD